MWDRGSNRTRIKLCWFDYLEAAYEASSIGADALGFHCLRDSTVDWRAKAEYFASLLDVLPSTVEKVLLVDYPLDTVTAILDVAAFDTVQLYPDWDPSEIDQLRSDRGEGIKVLKVMSARESENTPSNPTAFLDLYSSSADAILLDSYRGGGTGTLADSDYCASIVRQSGIPVIIAGGLNANNVGDRIRAIRPFGVDVETGVSDRVSGGRVLKNLGKCRAFVDAVVRADCELGRRRT